MKNLRLENMLLVSHREKKARKIDFHPKVTVIQGVNDTGKSSLIKSIPYTFGANPHKRHQKWKDADVATLIRFSVDGSKYSVYRHRGSFSLFDGDDQEIGTYSSVTLELAPVLAKLFDFNLKLTDRDGKSATPPPAYLMLPFYIDQDKGWTEAWSSFTNLSQFAYWKQRVTGYHFGLRPDKWYELETKRKTIENEKEEPARQLKSIESIRDKAYKELARVDFDIDVDSFKNEINQLLNKCDTLKQEESKYREKISNLRTEKIRLEAQVDIVARTHDELSEDYKFACQNTESSIGCPTCGAKYSNSFYERFDIAKDTETCTDLLTSLRQELNDLEKEMASQEISLSTVKDNQKEINDLLSKKKGQVKLSDLISIEGKKTLLSHLQKEADSTKVILDSMTLNIAIIQEDMEKYEDSERRNNIVLEYGENLRKFTAKLGVHSLSDHVFKNINSSIEESGSDLPRAILAYYFTALKAINKNGNATLFPLIIDAPNQQEQDPKNLRKMLDFIKNNRPEQQQLVIGLVDDSNVDFEGKLVTLNKKYSVLEEEQYELLSNEIRHFEALNLAIKD
jgi:DNA repair exonuclease SbcCD ATPase subunit